MPTYLDFESTRRYRDFIISKTLNVPNGPRSFTADSYEYRTQNEFSNVDLGDVDDTRNSDLSTPKRLNTYKPLNYLIYENLSLLPRRANLSLYPYFNPRNNNLIGIMNGERFDDESELMKFASSYIRSEDGPVNSRIKQNLFTSTVGKARIIDAFNGNTSTISNILRGKEPLIEFNNKITVNASLLGKGIDFLQTVSGVENPFTEIPGDYLTSPKTNVPGLISLPDNGPIFGLLRKRNENNPSDIMVEYLGEGQKQRLFDLLSYSKYSPNYTTTGRSQITSELLSTPSRLAQGFKNIIGLEAPNNGSYIGDDRFNNVKDVTNDFLGRQVKSPYYVSLLYDPIQTELFNNTKPYGNGGGLSTELTWISRRIGNQLGVNNRSFNEQSSKLNDSFSDNYQFRIDSILGVTQDILNSAPNNGLEKRSHVANVIDQTTRIYREGNRIMSKGSAIKYVDQYGQERGIEYCRVWTKDRPYATGFDLMKNNGLLRKYDSSVLTSQRNLNYAPMSNGIRSFEGSSNIIESGDGFIAKKFMFSIENLAWKSSNMKGFTYNDLPFIERGPNGGRVMWFPPYDLKITEISSANWEKNSILGRPEPIYTYQNSERSASLSFKVVVDHPSILNLLVNQFFKDMSDDEADNFINAFFAGCEELDFYELIRRYSSLSKDEVITVQNYLETTKQPEIDNVTDYQKIKDPITQNNESITTRIDETIFILKYDNATPNRTSSEFYTDQRYSDITDSYLTNDIKYSETYEDELYIISPEDKFLIFNSNDTISVETIDRQKQILLDRFELFRSEYLTYIDYLDKLKNDIGSNLISNLTILVKSGASSPDIPENNLRLSSRRSSSVINDILFRISNNSYKYNFSSISSFLNYDITIRLQDLGYTSEGVITFKVINVGESKPFCSKWNFKSKNLLIVSPEVFECRSTNIKISAEYIEQQPSEDLQVGEEPKIDNSTYNTPNFDQTLNSNEVQRPPLEQMKKIIMNVLSEAYYFKVMENETPIVFNSLKEKLKYFHPAFHSMTPEGLNSRLTFLQQCLRPGDTIPVKGLSDSNDLDARNTTFGPPPVCVMRIGDFYHSKVVISNINITYDDTTWDLNPEGIGVQPMIANVQLQLNFIGGQGLERPIERLQNALTSNFYANTEIYDPRSENTEKTINGTDITKFSKEFLEKLQDNYIPNTKSSLSNNTNNIISGNFIGTQQGSGFTYTELVNSFIRDVDTYQIQVVNLLNTYYGKFGKTLSSIVLSPYYRTLNIYEVFNGATDINLNLFGDYRNGDDVFYQIQSLRLYLDMKIKDEDIISLFNLTSKLPQPVITLIEEPLREELLIAIKSVFDELYLNDIVSLENLRNDLIKKLDRINFITKYGYDVTINQKNEIEKSVLSGFTGGDFYNTYSNVITSLNTINLRTFEEFNFEYNSKNVDTITNQQYTELVSYIVEINKTFLLNRLLTEGIGDKYIKIISRELERFGTKLDKFNFKVIKILNNLVDNQIYYDATPNEVVTDVSVIDEVFELYNESKPNKRSTLNYFRK